MRPSRSGRAAGRRRRDRASLLVGVRFARRPELDPAVRDAEQVGRPDGDLGQLRLDRRLLRAGAPSNVGGEGRLAPLLLRLRGAAPGARGERADADRDDEVDGERDPVLRLGEMERVGRRQEQPVEGEHADDRDTTTANRSPQIAATGSDGEEVEHAETEHRRDRIERVDRACDDERRAAALAAVPARRRRAHDHSIGSPRAGLRSPQDRASQAVSEPLRGASVEGGGGGDDHHRREQKPPQTPNGRPDRLDTVKRAVIGRPRATAELGETLLSKKLALPIFAADPLSSVAYATEAALRRPRSAPRSARRTS